MLSITNHSQSFSEKAVKPLGVVDQLRLGFQRGNRLAFVFGCVFGALVPLATFCNFHSHHATIFGLYCAYVLTAGGVLKSALETYGWSKVAYGSRWAAIGFLVIAEGTMTFADIPVWPYVALGYITFINAASVGFQFVHNQKAPARMKRRVAKTTKSAPQKIFKFA